MATEHAMIIAIWHMLTNAQPYHDLGSDFYLRNTPQSALRHRLAALDAAGYTVIKNQAA